MNNLLLIDNTIKNVDQFTSSINEHTKHILFDKNTDTFVSIRNKISQFNISFNSVALVSHNSPPPHFQMLRTETPCILDGKDTNSWKDFLDFIKAINPSNFDFLACSLVSHPEWVFSLDYLESLSGINIRASDDETGNLKHGGDWVLESDNVNIKDIYFNDQINLLDFTLTKTIFAGTLYAISHNLNGDFYTVMLQASQGIFTSQTGLDRGVKAGAITIHGHFLYYNNENGIYRYNTTTSAGDATFTLTNPFGEAKFPRMAIKNNFMYAGKNSILYKINLNDSSDVTQYTIQGPNGIKYGGGDFAFDNGGQLYMCTSSGIYTMNESNNIYHATEYISLPWSAASIVFDEDNVLWAVDNRSNANLWHIYNNKGVIVYYHEYLFLNHQINSIALPLPDTDGDGVDDNADAFPNDASETMDADGDGVGDNADAFPNDASASSGGGDPYIKPIYGVAYKLPDRYAIYRYVSNREIFSKRFTVDVDVVCLSKSVQMESLRNLLQYEKSTLVDFIVNQKKQLPLNGHFFRHYTITNNGERLDIDMELDMIENKSTYDQIHSTPNYTIKRIDETMTNNIYPYNRGQDRVIYMLEIKTFNETYGNIVINLYKFENPQLRNGITIRTNKRITHKNSKGCILQFQDTRNFTIKKLGSRKDILDYNTKKSRVVRKVSENFVYYNQKTSKSVNIEFLQQK